jgi:anion transporter
MEQQLAPVSEPEPEARALVAEKLEDSRWKIRLTRSRMTSIIGCFAALTVSLFVYFIPMHMGDSEQKCLGLLAFVSILWASEAIPLWVTSLCIPFIIVLTNIILKPNGEVLDGSDAAKRELAKIADPNVILLMGGFTIAAALHKYGMDVALASKIQRAVGTASPRLLIFVNMIVAFVLSMFCNNIAAPVVTFFLVTPVLHRIEDRKYCQCMVMSIAFASNIGGMPTPIASPQNAQALKVIQDTLHDDVSFISWASFALPICAILLPATWIWMLIWWRPELRSIPNVSVDDCDEEARSPVARFGWRHLYVFSVTVLTVGLWCAFDLVKNFFGSMGIVGLIPIILLYAPGVLEAEDFKRMDWGVLMLLGGGAALGDAVTSSGLLADLANHLKSGFDSAGISVYVQFMCFNFLLITIANFISHTVAAITMLGVVGKVGHAVNKGRAFVLGGVICDSGACGLPVSSFPNVLAYGIKDANGVGYLKATDFMLPALVMEAFTLVVMATLGWGLANLITN